MDKMDKILIVGILVLNFSELASSYFKISIFTLLKDGNF